MAISTYAELQTAAANWLGRADLTSRIPEFVALAEAKFNRTLRIRDMITKDAAFSITGEYVAVPTGFLEAKAFMLNASPRQELTFMPDDTQVDMYPTSNESPLFYSIVGSNFRFAPVPSATVTATLTYYKAIVALATTSPNWLLTSHPDIYLYGTLMEAAPYLGDDARVGVWAAGLRECVSQLRTQDARSNTANGMMVRTA
jgi:hypothetical protein